METAGIERSGGSQQHRHGGLTRPCGESFPPPGAARGSTLSPFPRNCDCRQPARTWLRAAVRVATIWSSGGHRRHRSHLLRHLARQIGHRRAFRRQSRRRIDLLRGSAAAGRLCDAIFRALPFIPPDKRSRSDFRILSGSPSTACRACQKDRLSFLLFPVSRPELFDAVIASQDGEVREIQVKHPAPNPTGCGRDPGAPHPPARAACVVAGARSRRRVCRHARQRLSRRGRDGTAVRAGKIYLDIGTLDGYRAAMSLSFPGNGRPNRAPGLDHRVKSLKFRLIIRTRSFPRPWTGHTSPLPSRPTPPREMAELSPPPPILHLPPAGTEPAPADRLAHAAGPLAWRRVAAAGADGSPYDPLLSLRAAPDRAAHDRDRASARARRGPGAGGPAKRHHGAIPLPRAPERQFRRVLRAGAADARRVAAINVIVSDPEGQEILNTRSASGPLAEAQQPGRHPKGRRRTEPVVSDLYSAP